MNLFFPDKELRFLALYRRETSLWKFCGVFKDRTHLQSWGFQRQRSAEKQAFLLLTLLLRLIVAITLVPPKIGPDLPILLPLSILTVSIFISALDLIALTCFYLFLSATEDCPVLLRRLTDLLWTRSSNFLLRLRRGFPHRYFLEFRGFEYFIFARGIDKSDYEKDKFANDRACDCGTSRILHLPCQKSCRDDELHRQTYR